MVGRFQTCMKKALKGKHIKGKTKWRAAFKAAAKRCAKGAKVRAKYTRKYRRKGRKVGRKRVRRVGRVRKVTRKPARVGTIYCVVRKR
jgi:hypothetical protein